MRKIIVAPSILSADFLFLNKEIEKISIAGADWLHFDVMDGHFVDNISFGIPVLAKIKGHHKLFNDVHIMISNPLHYAKRFVDAGADLLTFHLEACQNEEEVLNVIETIKNNGAKVGISIKPKTPIEEIYKYLDKIDLVLIMSVEPGFGGQSFIEESLEKIATLRAFIDENKYEVLIEVDGGINEDTSLYVKKAGADVLVAGSYLFGHKDIKERIALLKEIDE